MIRAQRELVEGQMVLMKIPRLGSKLNDAWDGPYEVIRIVTPIMKLPFLVTVQKPKLSTLTT